MPDQSARDRFHARSALARWRCNRPCGRPAQKAVRRPGAAASETWVRVGGTISGDSWEEFFHMHVALCCSQCGQLKQSLLTFVTCAAAACSRRSTLLLAPDGVRAVRRCEPSERQKGSYLVDPASSHMLVSKIKPCMSKYKLLYTVKLRMAH